jgi:tetratricopeptide (TPR) repeat protein
LLVPVILLFLARSPAFDASLRAGLVALEKNDLAQARLNLENAAKIEPSDPKVWVGLAQTFWKLHNASEANEAAAKAEKLGPQDAAVQHALSVYYAETDQFDKAGDAEAKYSTGAPTDRDAVLRSMTFYIKGGHADRAIAFAKATPDWSNRADVHNLLAKAYFANKQPDEAANEFRSAMQLSPYEESYYFDFAQALLVQQKFEQAIRVLEEGRTNFDKSAQIELALGVAYYGLRRFEEAGTAFLRTISLAPDVEQPYVFLGKMLDQIPDKLPELTRVIAQYEKSNPSDYLGYRLHAQALDAQSGDLAMAEKLLRKAISLNDRDAQGYFELGTLMEKQRRFPEAAEALERAAALNGSDPATHYRLARVYDRLGKRDAARLERDEHARLLKSTEK